MADIVEVSDGVRKQLLKEGVDIGLSAGDKITVSCTGTIASTGKTFWSTSDPGQQPFSFYVNTGQVIPGLDEGCMTMRRGERAKLYIAAHKGYGSRGFPAWGIPPNADLIVEIEILSIN